VQGVGFRPYVHALATRLRLAGRVGNPHGGVSLGRPPWPVADKRTHNRWPGCHDDRVSLPPRILLGLGLPVAFIAAVAATAWVIFDWPAAP